MLRTRRLGARALISSIKQALTAHARRFPAPCSLPTQFRHIAVRVKAVDVSIFSSLSPSVPHQSSPTHCGSVFGCCSVSEFVCVIFAFILTGRCHAGFITDGNKLPELNNNCYDKNCHCNHHTITNGHYFSIPLCMPDTHQRYGKFEIFELIKMLLIIAELPKSDPEYIHAMHVIQLPPIPDSFGQSSLRLYSQHLVAHYIRGYLHGAQLPGPASHHSETG